MPQEPENTQNQDPVAIQPQTKRPASLRLHERQCKICRHPDRATIEEDFRRWREPYYIVEEYSLPSRSALYRHAQATGLMARRRRNLRGVAERILENVGNATFTADAILRAMRVFAHITEDGKWIEPPKRTIVTHIHTFAPSAAPARSKPAAARHGRGRVTPAPAPLEVEPSNDTPAALPAQFLAGTQNHDREKSND